jgi:Ser/Thr protein kinase RdoA (MazF antagonist)
MTQDAAGSLLSLPPPTVPAAKLLRRVQRYWGLKGALTPLTSERDQNHRLDTVTGTFILKLANPAEPAELTDFQTFALLHTALTAPDLPCPRVIPTTDGRTILPSPEGALRLLTWLPGTPLALLPRTAALSFAIGTALGRLDVALASLHHSAADHHLLWDIRNASDLVALTPALPQDLKPRVQTYLDRFAAKIAPALAKLPRQVIHGDFNPHNLLADPAAPNALSGILDFGDMTLSHRICDLAVAASYLIDPADPAVFLIPLVGAYHRANPLTANEIRLLPDLITARLVTTLTISAWRAARYPANANYILRNAPVSRAGLDAMTDPASLTDHLLSACEGLLP